MVFLFRDNSSKLNILYDGEMWEHSGTVLVDLDTEVAKYVELILDQERLISFVSFLNFDKNTLLWLGAGT